MPMPNQGRRGHQGGTTESMLPGRPAGFTGVRRSFARSALYWSVEDLSGAECGRPAQPTRQTGSRALRPGSIASRRASSPDASAPPVPLVRLKPKR